MCNKEVEGHLVGRRWQLEPSGIDPQRRWGLGWSLEGGWGMGGHPEKEKTQGGVMVQEVGGGGRQLRDCLDWRHFKRTENSINLAGCGQLIKTVRAKRLILHLVFGPSGSVLGT